jgi:hypothetical protein
MTTPAPDSPDWAGGATAVTVGQPIQSVTLSGTVSSGLIPVAGFDTYQVQAAGGGSSAFYVTEVVSFDGVTIVSSGQPIYCTGVISKSSPCTHIMITPITGGFTTTYSVFGLPKQLSYPAGVGVGWQPEPWIGSSGNVAWVSGTQQGIGTSTYLFPPQGPCYMYASVSGTVVTGFLQAVTQNGNVMNLCDTSDMTTRPNNNRALFRTVAIPANVGGIRFLPFASGTAIVACQLTPQL